MIKRLLFALLIGLSFLFLLKTGVVNAYCTSDLTICKAKLGSFTPVCCRSSSCSSPCGTLSIWNYCTAECCYSKISSSCTQYCYGSSCYCDLKYSYKKIACSVADSCNGSIYLQPGICDSTGCSKGGNYKICCDNKKDGSVCPHVCSGGNNSGTCGSGCYYPGPNQLSCPVTGPNCGTRCAQNGCDACACNNYSRSSSYNWTNMGASSDCSSCLCGKTPPCNCSWSNQGCGQNIILIM